MKSRPWHDISEVWLLSSAGLRGISDRSVPYQTTVRSQRQWNFAPDSSHTSSGSIQRDGNCSSDQLLHLNFLTSRSRAAEISSRLLISLLKSICGFIFDWAVSLTCCWPECELLGFVTVRLEARCTGCTNCTKKTKIKWDDDVILGCFLPLKSAEGRVSGSSDWDSRFLFVALLGCKTDKTLTSKRVSLS